MYKYAQEFFNKKKPNPIQDKSGMMGIYNGTIAFGRAPRDHDEVTYMHCEYEPEIVVDLTETTEWSSYMNYRPLLIKEKNRGIKVDMIHFPIVDMRCPTNNQIDKFMNLMSRLEKIHNENRKIYIHCKGGHGRAGLIFGCLLSKLMNDKSYEEIQKIINNVHSQRTDCGNEWLQLGAPQTSEQINFLKQYIEYNNSIHEKKKKKLNANKIIEDKQKQLEYILKEYENKILSENKTTYTIKGISSCIRVEY